MNDIRLIVDLLKQATTIQVVSDFLKSRKARHSAGSWENLYKERIMPAISNQQLTGADLINMLRTVEEYGKQHVFLFKCSTSDAEEMMDVDRVTRILSENGIDSVLSNPKILDQPSKPTIADVRWETTGEGTSLTVKIIEQRISQKYVGDVVDGDFLVKKYQRVMERAVNVVKLHSDGLLEMRIASHSNSSEYVKEIQMLWAQSLVFEKDKFSHVSLSKVKKKLLVDRQELLPLIRHSNSTLRNDTGTVIRATTGTEESDLLEDEGAVSSIDAFMRHDDSYCDSSNFWFRSVDGVPSKDVHVILTGAINEFVLTANCSKDDYTYVLNKLRILNS